MQNDRSGAPAHHQKDGEVLSPVDAAARDRGQALKRCVRAAAALRGLYDDTAIAEAVGVNRGAVGAWWDGAQMKPDTIQRMAEATGLSFGELTEYVYLGGPLPRLPEPSGPAGLREGVRRGQEPLADGAPDRPAQSPGPPPHDVEGEHAPRRGK